MIIHPIFFYLMNVFHAADLVAILIAICSAIAACVPTIMWIIATIEGYENETHPFLKFIKSCMRVFAFSLIATILIPSEDTMLMMLAACVATTENVNSVFEALKAAIDYAITILQ